MTRSRVGRGAVVATIAAALTIGGVAAPAPAATKPYTPATWTNSESTRLDGPGYKLTPKLGGKTKGSPHVNTPLGAVKGPKGSKSPAFSVQANAKAPADKKATGTRYIKGPKAAAFNYALHKHGGQKKALSRAALAYLAYANFDVSKTVRTQVVKQTSTNIKTKASAFMTEGLRNRGPYTAKVDVTTKDVKLGVKSASGRYAPGIAYTVTLSGPAMFSNGAKKLTGKTASTLTTRAIKVSGNGKVTAKFEVKGLPKDVLTVKKTKGYADVIVPASTLTKRATDSVAMDNSPSLVDVKLVLPEWPMHTGSRTFYVDGRAKGSYVVGQMVAAKVGSSTATGKVHGDGRWAIKFEASDVGVGTHNVAVTLIDAKGRKATATTGPLVIRGGGPLIPIHRPEFADLDLPTHGYVDQDFKITGRISGNHATDGDYGHGMSVRTGHRGPTAPDPERRGTGSGRTDRGVGAFLLGGSLLGSRASRSGTTTVETRFLSSTTSRSVPSRC